jgi:hypothetical protein
VPDEPFYSPNTNPPTARVRRSGEVLWTLTKNHVFWSCELRFHGESVGWEAQILRDGDLVMARTFQLHDVMVGWAESERVDIERGWVE